jgi:hypothetical protein
MTQEPIRQEVLRVCDGEVLITFPANMSRRCIDELKVQFDAFIEKLRCAADTDRQAFLRGLAELAAYDAARGQGGNTTT